jgi:hypothetical protein
MQRSDVLILPLHQHNSLTFAYGSTRTTSLAELEEPCNKGYHKLESLTLPIIFIHNFSYTHLPCRALPAWNFLGLSVHSGPSPWPWFGSVVTQLYFLQHLNLPGCSIPHVHVTLSNPRINKSCKDSIYWSSGRQQRPVEKLMAHHSHREPRVLLQPCTIGQDAEHPGDADLTLKSCWLRLYASISFHSKV